MFVMRGDVPSEERSVLLAEAALGLGAAEVTSADGFFSSRPP
jgi:hypothetical protein